MTYMICFLANLAFAGFLHYGLHFYNAHLDLRTIQGLCILGMVLSGGTTLTAWLIPADRGFVSWSGRFLCLLFCTAAGIHALGLFLWLQTKVLP